MYVYVCIYIIRFLAVADGVGGWAEHGVDPGKYSKELCSQYRYIYTIIYK